jgi:Protein of unknown function (DUF2442)
MPILANNNLTATPQATTVHFTENTVHISLSDGQVLDLDLHQDWLQWLLNATPEQRNRWSLEPRGSAVYWDDLDDGIEVCHALEAALVLS